MGLACNKGLQNVPRPNCGSCGSPTLGTALLKLYRSSRCFSLQRVSKAFLIHMPPRVGATTRGTQCGGGCSGRAPSFSVAAFHVSFTRTSCQQGFLGCWELSRSSAQDAEKKAKSLNAEINNGRLAMFAIIGSLMQGQLLDWVCSLGVAGGFQQCGLKRQASAGRPQLRHVLPGWPHRLRLGQLGLSDVKLFSLVLRLKPSAIYAQERAEGLSL